MRQVQNQFLRPEIAHNRERPKEKKETSEESREPGARTAAKRTYPHAKHQQERRESRHPLHNSQASGSCCTILRWSSSSVHHKKRPTGMRTVLSQHPVNTK